MARKFPRSEMSFEFKNSPKNEESSSVHTFAFRSEAMAMMEDMMKVPFIDIVDQKLYLGKKFTSVAIFTGKLAFKTGGKRGKWSLPAAMAMLDKHIEYGGDDWQAFNMLVVECILENDFPEVYKAAKEHALAAEEEAGRDERPSDVSEYGEEKSDNPTDAPNQD